jgi:peroxiredoxin/Tfp pilus assembly protein PilF
MRKTIINLCALCLLFSFRGYAYQKGESLNVQPSESVRRMVRDAVELAERDKTSEALKVLKKAISLAPNYLQAHSEYIRIRTYFLEQYDEVKSEYDGLIEKEPDNPVYPMALAMGQPLTIGESPWFKRVAELAPDWAWGHYARAALIAEKEPESAVAELFKCIEKDKTLLPAYYFITFLLSRAGKYDEAISIAERMAAQPDLRPSGLSILWQLRLEKSQGSEEFKAALRDELNKLAESSPGLEILANIHSLYSSVMNDSDAARAVEEKIHRIDPSWYPERGSAYYIATSNLSEIPRQLVAASRQARIERMMSDVGNDLDFKEKVKQLERLLDLGPSPGIKWHIYRKLFLEAEKAGENAAVLKYGEKLYSMDKTDTALLAKMAIALADEKRDLRKALRYARLAEESASKFLSVQKPANTDESWFKANFPLEREQNNYKKQQALSLHALGWVLCQKGSYLEAEARLRQSIELERSEKRLLHLAEALRKLGRAEEAQKFSYEAENEWLESLKRQFTNKAAKEFQLQAIDGRNYRLSDFKGKVVMINFWATWCDPCANEMPHLVKMYEKYKQRGFEILAVSVDSKPDRYKVAPFAKKYNMAFPVLFDEGVADLYNIKGYPTNIFIDRQGNLRYRQFGFDEEAIRIHEAVINELLK